jgi:hypothetical protein
MKKIIATCFVLALVLTAVSAFAGKAENVELEGTLLCAKCSLKQDFKECTSALVVKKGEKEKIYYLVDNEVLEAAGKPCMDKSEAKVSGTAAKKDGKTWVTATRIEKL